VAESIDELFRKLIDEHGFEERSMFVAEPQGAVVPDGVYLERRQGGFAVWVPPDPDRTVGNNPMLPPAVLVQSEPHSRGHRLVLRRKMARSNKVAIAGASIGWLACATILLSTTAPLSSWFLPVMMPLVIMGLLIGHQARIAQDRANSAWDALATALGPLAITGEVADDPYRGDEPLR
jgi:hypothetical protein